MALADQSFAIGPLNVPGWLAGVLAGLLAVAVLQRTLWRTGRQTWRVTNDALLSGALTGMVVWKLVPLATRFAEIAEAPSRLLYYPGGTPGIVLGVLAGSGVAVLSLVRARVAVDRALATHIAVPLVAVVTGIAVTLIPFGGRGAADPLTSARTPGAQVAGWPVLAGFEPVADDALPTVVTVWATWCGPCTAQMPEISRFHAEYGSRANVVALNLLATESGEDAVRAYLQESGLDIPVALDPSGRISRELEVRSTPTTIVYDASGRERARRTGAVNVDWLVRRVLPLGR